MAALRSVLLVALSITLLWSAWLPDAVAQTGTAIGYEAKRARAAKPASPGTKKPTKPKKPEKPKKPTKPKKPEKPKKPTKPKKPSNPTAPQTPNVILPPPASGSSPMPGAAPTAEVRPPMDSTSPEPTATPATAAACDEALKMCNKAVRQSNSWANALGDAYNVYLDIEDVVSKLPNQCLVFLPQISSIVYSRTPAPMPDLVGTQGPAEDLERVCAPLIAEVRIKLERLMAESAPFARLVSIMDRLTPQGDAPLTDQERRDILEDLEREAQLIGIPVEIWRAYFEAIQKCDTDYEACMKGKETVEL